MKTRKLVSLGLAAVMSLSLSVPAFADAEATPTNMETNFTATYAEPVIDVTVPQNGTVALNPLGLDVEMDPADATQTIKGLQIVTTPTVIVNKSKMELDVNAKVVTKTTGKLTLAESEQAVVGNGDVGDADYVAPATGKSAFVFFQMKASAKTDPSVVTDLNKEAAAWTYDYTETITTTPASGDTPATTTVTPDTDGCLILKGDTKGVTVTSEEPLVTLKASTDGTTVAAGGIAQMRIAGKMVQNPQGTKGDDPWTTTDGLNAVVTFTFTPHVGP